MRYETKSGNLAVTYYIDTISGCCGMASVHSMSVDNCQHSDLSSDEARNDICELFNSICREVREKHYGMFFVSSIPPGGMANPESAYFSDGAQHEEDGLNLYTLAKAGRMREVARANNPNTDNNIVMFCKVVEKEADGERIEHLRGRHEEDMW